MSESVKLSDVVEIMLGQTFRGKAESSDPSSGIKLIQIKDIIDTRITNIEHLPYADLPSEKSKIKIQPNDLLIPLRGNRFITSLFNFDSSDVEVTTTNQIAILRASTNKMNIRYLLWYLNSISGRNSLAQISKGATIPAIKRSDLESLEIPLPEIQEQLKVVAIYFNWLEQTEVLKKMLTNGEKLVEKHCYALSHGGNS